jgi:aminoglycoside 6'-N-acetyltransferase
MLAGLLIRDKDLIMRLMRDASADYATMSKWLTDVRVLKFYEGRDRPFSIDQVKEKYSPHFRPRRRHILPLDV